MTGWTQAAVVLGQTIENKSVTIGTTVMMKNVMMAIGTVMTAKMQIHKIALSIPAILRNALVS